MAAIVLLPAAITPPTLPSPCVLRRCLASSDHIIQSPNANISSDTVHGVYCCWKRPPPGFVAVNCDGSFKPLEQMGGYGVILRNRAGQIILSKANHHEVYQEWDVDDDLVVLTEELLAIRDGLRMSRRVHCLKVEIQSDSKNAIDIIGGVMFCPRYCLGVLREIQAELPFFKGVFFVFVFRESNRAADHLSKLLTTEGDIILDAYSLPRDLQKIVVEDANGVGVYRK